jgi:flagellar protein FliO/FliZ
MIGSSLQAIAGLGLVLGLILTTAYVLRKLQPGRFSSGNLTRIVSALNVGARERVIVVEFGEQLLVLGVTAQSITTLHTAPRELLQRLQDSADAPPQPLALHSFVANLRQWRERIRSNAVSTQAQRHD